MIYSKPAKILVKLYTNLVVHFVMHSSLIAAEGSTPNLDPVFRADLCIGEIEILCLSGCRNSGGERRGGGGVREKY